MLLLLAAGLLSAGTVVSQDTVETLLEGPLSPGRVALLVDHVPNRRVEARLEEALAHEEPEVRAAAARVVRATGLGSLASGLARALEKETDPRAGVEEIYAAAFSAVQASSILEAGERLELIREAALALAASEGPAVLDRLDRLRALEPELSLLPVLRLASRGRMASLGPLVARSLREKDDPVWSAFLALARERGYAVERGQLVYAVTVPELRASALSHLVLVNALDAALVQPARESLAASTEELELETRFLLELLSRREGGPPREDAAWIAARRAGEPTRLDDTPSLAPPSRILLLLTKGERRALSEQLRGDAGTLDDDYERSEERREELSSGPPHASGPSTLPVTPVLESVDGFPNGMVDDLLGVTGCRPREILGVVTARVQFTTNGRPNTVSLGEVVSHEGCQLAATVLLRTSVLAPSELSAVAKRANLAVPLEPGVLACLDADDATGASFRSDGGRLKPPMVIRDVAPVYPEAAKEEGVRGAVIVDAVLHASGCLRELQVPPHADSRLAIAALASVAQWRFEPATQTGRPVSVSIQVVATFSMLR